MKKSEVNTSCARRKARTIFVLLMLILPRQIFAQADSLFTALPEGAYLNLDDVKSRRASFEISDILQSLTRITDANTLLLPQKEFGRVKFIMLNKALFLRQGLYNAAPKMSRLSVAANLAQPDHVRFVRVFKVGSICLTMNNKLLKLDEGVYREATPANLRRMMHDDADLKAEFRKEKDQDTAIYRFIDKYNSRHPVFW